MFFDVHTHTATKDGILNIFPAQEVLMDQLFSVGIHPWYLNELEHQKQSLQSLALDPNCLAIGECGLDRVCDSDFNLQKEVFDFQIDLANQINKPLIIHCVKAFETVLPMLKKAKTFVILHGFNQKEQIHQACLMQSNICFSFGAALIKENSNAQKAILNTPLDRLFLETDDQTSFSIEDVFTKTAELLDLSLEVLSSTININKIKVFK
jgi:TatD DNase family protein